MLLSASVALLLLAISVAVQGASVPIYCSSELKDLLKTTSKHGEVVHVALTETELSYSETLRQVRALYDNSREVRLGLYFDDELIEKLEKASDDKREKKIKKKQSDVKKATGHRLRFARVTVGVSEDVVNAFKDCDMVVLTDGPGEIGSAAKAEAKEERTIAAPSREYEWLNSATVRREDQRPIAANVRREAPRLGIRDIRDEPLLAVPARIEQRLVSETVRREERPITARTKREERPSPPIVVTGGVVRRPITYTSREDERLASATVKREERPITAPTKREESPIVVTGGVMRRPLTFPSREDERLASAPTKREERPIAAPPIRIEQRPVSVTFRREEIPWPAPPSSNQKPFAALGTTAASYQKLAEPTRTRDSLSRLQSGLYSVPRPAPEIVDVNDLPPNFNPSVFIDNYMRENNLLRMGGLFEHEIAYLPSAQPIKDSCGICMGSLQRHARDEADNEIKGGLLKMRNCSHVYHRSCATNWLLRKNTCPSCRERAYP